VFAGIAIISAATTIFFVPAVFRWIAGETRFSLGGDPGVIIGAMRSADARERAVGRLGLLTIAQMLKAVVPTLVGFAAFLVGARPSVFAAFVVLSVVVLAAVFPRRSEWDDSIERLASEVGAAALES
jgi:hypothetical protein